MQTGSAKLVIFVFQSSILECIPTVRLPSCFSLGNSTLQRSVILLKDKPYVYGTLL
jgi:hypothetical protein